MSDKGGPNRGHSPSKGRMLLQTFKLRNTKRNDLTMIKENELRHPELLLLLDQICLHIYMHLLFVSYYFYSILN